jgi:hypothetical protein
VYPINEVTDGQFVEEAKVAFKAAWINNEEAKGMDPETSEEKF